ncbi:hypothetical protein WJX72_001390 [[Myrmecia] bisecta]|uniref:Uncharacterized protein n=1 Tax=[Myrmecia] bisecta TaxID=41462 RepID=A0AAW1R4R4_9CHLO
MAEKKNQRPPTAQRTDSAALADLEKGSAVITLIAKRLRAARKKLGRVAEVEKARDEGKPINSDQEAMLRSRPSLEANIEELERLLPLLKDAVKEEKAVAVEQAVSEKDAQHEKEKVALAEEAARKEAEKAKEAEAEPKPEPAQPKEEVVGEAVGRLLPMLYFSQLFHVTGGYVAGCERDACVSYDYTVESEGESLTSDDLRAISEFGRLMMSRPSSEPISHKDALDRCKELALKWLNNESEFISEVERSVSDLSAKFERVLASEYFTIKPHITTVKPEPTGEPEAHTESITEAANGPQSFYLPQESEDAFQPTPTSQEHPSYFPMFHQQTGGVFMPPAPNGTAPMANGYYGAPQAETTLPPFNFMNESSIPSDNTDAPSQPQEEAPAPEQQAQQAQQASGFPVQESTNGFLPASVDGSATRPAFNQPRGRGPREPRGRGGRGGGARDGPGGGRDGPGGGRGGPGGAPGRGGRGPRPDFVPRADYVPRGGGGGRGGGRGGRGRGPPAGFVQQQQPVAQTEWTQAA